MFPEVIYETPLSPNKQFIYCPNHISYLDIVLTGSFLPSFNFFMAKMELSKLPLFKIKLGGEKYIALL
jgi:1-acyl-sn-glycerol-3-phosphate acyltransferase